MRQLLDHNEEGFVLHIGTKDVLAKPESKDGQKGFAILYPDGYRSWSPAHVFRDAYRQNGSLHIGHAYSLANRGFRVRRVYWPVNRFVRFLPSANDQFSVHEYCALEGTLTLGVFLVDGPSMQPWSPTQIDQVNEDWEIHPDDLGERYYFRTWAINQVSEQGNRRLVATLPNSTVVVEFPHYADLLYYMSQTVIQDIRATGVIPEQNLGVFAECPPEIAALGGIDGQYEYSITLKDLLAAKAVFDLT